MRTLLFIIVAIFASCEKDDNCECQYIANLDLYFDSCYTDNLTEDWNFIAESNPKQVAALHAEGGCSP